MRRFVAGGSYKSILYDDLDGSDRLKVYDRGVDVSTDPSGNRVLISYRSGDVVSPKFDAAESLFHRVEHFADCTGGESPRSAAVNRLRIVRVLTAAQESLSRGSERVMVLNPCRI